GQPEAPAVERDHARERREALEQPHGGLVLPDQLDVRDEPVDEHDVELALAEHLVREVDVAASRVPGLGSCRRCDLCVYLSASHAPAEQCAKSTGANSRAPAL